jgi:LysR family transcriptional activator of nhaA
VCRQAEIGPLVNQLQAHRLDLVLADEPASSSLKAKTFNHRLGRSGITFCALPQMAKKLRRNFPKSLHQAPALLPSDNMGMREPLEKWFYAKGIRPRIVGEFEDAGLMKVAASAGLGFTMVHSVVDKVALKHFGLGAIAKVKECASDFYAITIERRLKHPVVAAITEHAYSELFA